MQSKLLYIICCMPLVLTGPANRESIRQSSSTTFQDDEEFEMFYDVLREISKDEGGEDERDQELTTTTTPSPEQQQVVKMEEEEGSGERKEGRLLEDSVEEVMAVYEGGLVEIIRQAELQEEEGQGERKRVALVVGAAVGGSIGALMLVMSGLVALYLWQRRRKGAPQKKRGDQSVRSHCDFTPVPN